MSETKKRLTRREFLKFAGIASSAGIVSACVAPAPQTVVETVVVEKEVEKIVQETVEVEKVVTAVPAPVKKDATLVIGTPTEDQGYFYPLTHLDYPGFFLSRGLLVYDFKGGSFDTLPALAKEYEVLDDGLRYRMHLRDDVVFHSGKPYEAEDSVWYLHMQIQDDHPYHHLAKRGQSRARNVDHLEAVDKYTLDVYLTSVFPAEPDWLTSFHEWSPQNPETIMALEEEIVNQPDGLGPYKLLEWQKGTRTVLERHDNFWDPEEGKAGQIIFRPIPEQQAMIAALEAGEIHWMGDVPVNDALRLATTPGIKIAKRNTLYVWYITLDMRKAPLDNVLVRQALNYAVDKETLIGDILGGAGQRSYGPLGPEFGPYYAGDVVQHYDYDPQKAKDLLAEAGFPNGFDEIDGEPAVLYTYTGRIGAQKPVEMCEFIQAQWKDVGVNVGIEVMDFGAFEEKRVQGEFAMATRGWTPSTADPDGLISQNFHGDFRPPDGRNVTYLNDDEVNNLIDTAQTTIDMPKRIQAFHDAQKRIADLAPWVFIDHEVAFEAYSEKLMDYVPWPGGRAAGANWAWLQA
jgi:peptide/nickel transport system substrate-binding protein